MKNMMKLMCAACLAFTAVTAAMPAECAVFAEDDGSESAAEPYTGTLASGQTWTLSADGTLTVSGTGNIEGSGEKGYSWHTMRESVTKVVIGEGITGIGNSAFYDFMNLTEISIAKTVTFIGDIAFYSCGSLTGIKLPDSVTKIGKEAFMNCDHLAGITIGKNLQSIGNGAFTYCYGLKSVTVDTKNAYFCTADGVLFSKDKTKLLLYPAGRTQTSYSIPKGVTYIGAYAFHANQVLEKITFPTTLELTDIDAFYGSKWLKQRQAESNFVVANGILINAERCEGAVTVPDNVRKIGTWAFYRFMQSKVTSVVLPETVTAVTENAWYGCGGVTSVTIYNRDCKIESLPENAKIYGYRGSTADTMAAECGLTFIPLDPDADILGDFDGNGKVEIEDAQQVLNVYTDILTGYSVELTVQQETAGDVNSDQTIDVRDAQFILIYYTENVIAGKQLSWKEIIGS